MQIVTVYLKLSKLSLQPILLYKLVFEQGKALNWQGFVQEIFHEKHLNLYLRPDYLCYPAIIKAVIATYDRGLQACV